MRRQRRIRRLKRRKKSRKRRRRRKMRKTKRKKRRRKEIKIRTRTKIRRKKMIRKIPRRRMWIPWQRESSCSTLLMVGSLSCTHCGKTRKRQLFPAASMRSGTAGRL